MNILLTCPPMIKQIEKYIPIFKKYNLVCHIPEFTQTLSEEKLCEIIHEYDGWIIGDDPCTKKVLLAGKKGKLKACVKWGVGVDNVDFDACKELGIPIINTPNMFGEEVSTVAIGYLINLSRKLFSIHDSVLNNEWDKPPGESLYGKKISIIGFGDIGKSLVRKLKVFNMNIWVSDPMYMSKKNEYKDIHIDIIDKCLKDTKYIIVCCCLNKSTKNLINKDIILKCSRGVKIINVGRGGIVNEDDVCDLLETGFIDSVALDVFEKEPLNINSRLRKYRQNIFGSHNSSNTIEAVDKVSEITIEKISSFLS